MKGLLAGVSEEGKLPLEEVDGSAIAEEFPVHPIHTAGDGVAVFLPDVFHALSFREAAEDDTVCVLVGVSLAGCIGVAVVEARDQSLEAVGILELRTVIDGDALEGVFREPFEYFFEGGDRIAEEVLAEALKMSSKQVIRSVRTRMGSFFSLALPITLSIFPVAEGGADGDDQRAAFDTGAFRRFGSLDFPIPALYIAIWKTSQKVITNSVYIALFIHKLALLLPISIFLAHVLAHDRHKKRDGAHIPGPCNITDP